MRSFKSRMFCSFGGIVLAFCCANVQATGWWSLAAFKDPDNAERESSRISADSAFSTRVARSGDLYRVVLQKDGDPARQKAALESLGMTPWTITDVQVSDEVADPVSVAEYSFVLASFMDAATADALVEKLQADGVSNIDVAAAEVGGVRYYRVFQGPFSRKTGEGTAFAKYGLADGWWSTALVLAKVVESEPMATAQRLEVSESIEVPEEVEAALVVSPPKASENLRDYCLYRANRDERKIYCTNDAFNRVAGAQARVKREPAADNLLFCAVIADATARDQQCGQD